MHFDFVIELFALPEVEPTDAVVAGLEAVVPVVDTGPAVVDALVDVGAAVVDGISLPVVWAAVVEVTGAPVLVTGAEVADVVEVWPWVVVWACVVDETGAPVLVVGAAVVDVVETDPAVLEDPVVLVVAAGVVEPDVEATKKRNKKLLANQSLFS